MGSLRVLFTCFLLLLCVSSASAAGVFETRARYDFGLQPGINTLLLDRDDTYATQLTIYSKRSFLAEPIVYTLKSEPIEKYQIPRTALQYFAIEEPALNKYIMEWAEITIRIPTDNIRNIGANQLALYVFDPVIEEYVRTDFKYIGVQDNVHTWKATTNLLGYFVLAKLESYEVVTDVLGNPTSNRLAVESTSSQSDKQTVDWEKRDEQLIQKTNAENITSTSDSGSTAEVATQQTPEVQSPAQTTQLTLMTILEDPTVLMSLLVFLVSIFVALGIMLVSKQKNKTKTKRVTKPVSETEEKVLKNLRKELNLQTHHSITRNIQDVQKELLKKYSAPRQESLPEPPPIAEEPSRALPDPEDVISTNKDPSWEDGLSEDVALQAKITELQSTLSSLEQLDSASNKTSKKSASKVVEIIDSKSQEVQEHINELEPQMIKNYIMFAKRKGTSESKIIETLVNLGFDNSSIQHYLH